MTSSTPSSTRCPETRRQEPQPANQQVHTHAHTHAHTLESTTWHSDRKDINWSVWSLKVSPDWSSVGPELTAPTDQLTRHRDTRHTGPLLTNSPVLMYLTGQVPGVSYMSYKIQRKDCNTHHTVMWAEQDSGSEHVGCCYRLLTRWESC